MSYGYVKLRKVENGKYVRHLGTLAWGAVDGRLTIGNASATVMRRLAAERERGISPVSDAFVLFKAGKYPHEIVEILGIGVRLEVNGNYPWVFRHGLAKVNELVEGEL